jgi:hypothetical protein
VEATNYADQVVGQMWADRVNLLNYPTFAAPAAAAWQNQVAIALPGPGAGAIAVTPDPNGNLVTVTVSWTPPGLPSGAPANNVVVQTRIDNP